MPKKKSKIRNMADRGREELVFKDDDQHYAHVIKSLGSGRFELDCDDGTSRIGKLRGNMRKSQWVSAGCIVLVSFRDFEESSHKADILLKYSEIATKQLRRYGELEWLLLKATRGHGDDTEDTNEDLVVFDDDGDAEADDIDITAI